LEAADLHPTRREYKPQSPLPYIFFTGDFIVIAITRSKCGVKISDIFFADTIDNQATPSPILFFVQAATKHPTLTPFNTLAVDLTASVEEISSPISRNTRYKINRAEREGLTPRIIQDPNETDASLYARFYDTFARSKGLPPCNEAKLRALCSSSGLILSSVSDAQGALLASHAYVKDTSLGRVRLLYSASNFRALSDSSERNKIGRANRLLHWYEILTLKQLGFRLYDLGGLPVNSQDKAKNDIARFKLEFGGKPLTEYSGLMPTSLLGRIILSLYRKRL